MRHDGKVSEVRGKAVVLASGGFEANPEWRTRYLGPGWDLAKVRGSRFNAGDGIRMALDIGASPCGNWSGCHAVGWEMNAPEFGDLAVGDQFQKHSYPFAIMVNATGKRFVDEGADFRNYTYAKYGRVILEQPGQFAWQIFDQKVKHLQRDEYRIRQITKRTANTIEELATQLDGVNAAEFVKTIKEWNAAVNKDVPFNPNVKDGRNTKGLAINKSNWANTFDERPFEAYAVTCGVTFTFGGLRINTDCEVLNTDYQPIRGLYAAGELVGGLFYFNYPGGSGLCSGSVFGKIAGTSAGGRRIGNSSASANASRQRRARPWAAASFETRTSCNRAERQSSADEPSTHSPPPKSRKASRRRNSPPSRARLPRAHRSARAGGARPGPRSIPTTRCARRARSTADQAAARCTACRSASRTSSTPPTCRPRWARRSTRAIARSPTPPASRSCARPAR